MLNGKFIIAIDFDGTIVENEYPAIGKLKVNAKKIINKLYDEGYYIIIWTCRSNQNSTKDDLEIMKEYLDQENIKYHKINENIDGLCFNPYPKIYADLYVDDRNLITISKWDLIYEVIQHKLEIVMGVKND